ncbi:acid-sensing ion channel 2-like [Dysidea avara]|uniref:acid-sensing ion channel 2-like n=1 Tax=Dysidea avara TaxID=196820 RepID=UPI0033279378
MNGTVQNGNYLRLPELGRKNEVIGRLLRSHSISMPNLTIDFAAEQPDNCDHEPKATSSLFNRIKLRLRYKLWFMGTMTSFDGVRFAAIGYPMVRIIMWAILFSLSVAAMIWSIYAITSLYLARDTFFTRQKHFPRSLIFPAVTICNHNPYYNISVNSSMYFSLPIEAQVAILYEYYKRDRLFEADYERILNILDGRYNISHTEFNQSVTLETILREHGHKLEYGFKRCEFDGKECGIDNFTEVVTAYGLCYTFNLDSTRNVTGAGTSHSLFLMIDIEQYSYMYYTSHTAGLQVFIHPQDEYPYSGEFHGFSVPPGFETQVAISLTNTKLMEPPYGQCGDRPINNPHILPCKMSASSTEDDDMNTTNSTDHEETMMDCPPPIRRYTRQRCLDECEAIYQNEACGCKADYLPGDNISVCDLNMLFGCLLNVTEQFAQIKNSLCDCPIECNRVQYKTKLSQSYFPAYQYTTPLQRLIRYVYPPETIRQNLLALLVYYDQLEYTEVTEEAVFNMFRYIADIGSCAGLFTGAGVLTFFELFELCL